MKSPTDIWNDRYRSNPAAYGKFPNRFLAGLTGILPQSGRALLPGDGQGRNGVWLAQQGLEPLCVDLSAVGLEQAERAAKLNDVKIETWVGDFLELEIQPASYDLVAAIFFHVPPPIRQATHTQMAKALKPGGLLVIEAFAKGHLCLRERHNSGGPGRSELLYSKDDIRDDLSGLRCLYMEDITMVLQEGEFHNGLGRVVRAVFQK
jgi:SAM-dependent methyltransferase